MAQQGSVQTIVVCVDAPVQQAPCPAGMGLTTVQGYLIDAGQAASYEAQFAAFDYAKAAEIFSFGFCFVVGMYLLSKSAGIVLQRIRS